MKPAITVIGAGRMGSALARAFLANGHATAVWNRTASRSEPLAALGARVATTVEEAVAGAEVVVACVRDYAASDDQLRSDGMAEKLRGKLIVQLTSGTPRQAREASGWAREHGIHYLDGAIMATPDLVGGAGCTVLYSGEGGAFEDFKSTLVALGENAVYLGPDAGHASALDNALLSFLWGALFGTLLGVSICEAEGIPLGAYLGSVKAMAPAVDGTVTDLVERIESGRLAADGATAASVETCHASVRYLLELCEEHGIRPAGLEGFDRIFRAAVEAGHGRDDFAMLSKFMR